MGLVLLVNNDVPVRTLKEMVAQAKAAPDKFSYGSFGTGSSVHFGGEMLKSVTGMRMMHVPFNGSSPSLTALMGGQVQVAVDTVVASTPLVKAGKVRAIAALGPQRLELLPDVPTVAESGYPGFDMGTWFAFLAPAGLPAPRATQAGEGAGRCDGIGRAQEKDAGPGPDARQGQRRSLAQPGRARAAAHARRGCACGHPGGLRRGRREGSVSGGR